MIVDPDTMKLLINALQRDEIGLNDFRQAILTRVLESGDWAMFQKQIEPMDLVWLAAKTGDWFALMRSACLDILFHGQKENCCYDGILKALIQECKLRVIAICRPGEVEPKMIHRTMRAMNNNSVSECCANDREE